MRRANAWEPRDGSLPGPDADSDPPNPTPPEPERQPEPCPGLRDPAAPCLCEPREVPDGMGGTIDRYPHGRGTA